MYEMHTEKNDFLEISKLKGNENFLETNIYFKKQFFLLKFSFFLLNSCFMEKKSQKFFFSEH